MKKFVALFLFFFYSISSFGMMLQLNYCDGQLSSFDLFNPSHVEMDCCESGYDEEPCCSTLMIEVDAPQEDLNIPQVQKEIQRPIPFVAKLPEATLLGINTLSTSKAILVKAQEFPPSTPRLHVVFGCFRN